jgi:hypothetical protein
MLYHKYVHYSQLVINDWPLEDKTIQIDRVLQPMIHILSLNTLVNFARFRKHFQSRRWSSQYSGKFCKIQETFPVQDMIQDQCVSKK